MPRCSDDDCGKEGPGADSNARALTRPGPSMTVERPQAHDKMAAADRTLES